MVPLQLTSQQPGELTERPQMRRRCLPYAYPSTRVERGLVLLIRGFEYDGTAAVASKIHDGGQLVRVTPRG